MTNEFSNQSENIRIILLKEWDPIGVKNFQESQDEYDGYISDILMLISSDKGEAEIFNYLLWAETENMGLSADLQKTRVIANKLAALAK